MKNIYTTIALVITGTISVAHLTLANSNINVFNFIKYKNPILELEFEYPKIWGDFEFQPLDFGEIEYELYNDQIYGKGQNKDYISYNDAPLQFKGFESKTINEMCSSSALKIPLSPIISNCTQINKNIISLIAAPRLEDICSDFPSLINFEKILAINLPNNENLNGFIILKSFFSKELEQEFNALVEKSTVICAYPGFENGVDSETIKNKFDTKVQEILNRIETGEIDDETKENLENFDYFANSIEEWKAFENWPDWAQTEITWALNNNILDSDESVLEKVDKNSFKYTLAKMLYSYYINDTGTKYEGEIINGAWPDWADESVSWAIDQKIIDSSETVTQEVSDKDFKYMLATMLYRYYLSAGGTKYEGEIIDGNWPDWSNESVSWAINEKIIDSSETVMEPVSEEAFKYTLSVILKRYDESKNY